MEVLGMDVRKQSEAVLREVGYMPSEAMFYPSMRVKDVIRFAADMRGMDCSKEAAMLCEIGKQHIQEKTSRHCLDPLIPAKEETSHRIKGRTNDALYDNRDAKGNEQMEEIHFFRNCD